MNTMTYEVTGRIARITLNRPERGNGITIELPLELAACVERANLDPAVHVIALAGNGSGFCGGYDLVESAEGLGAVSTPTTGTPLDPAVVRRRTTIPNSAWDPTIDYAMMSRNVRGFMSLFHGEKPVVCKVHGFCVAGGTDMALCSDLLVIADDAKIGYPPARVWGVAHDRRSGCIASASRRRSAFCSPATASPARRRSRGASRRSRAPARELDERFEIAARAHRARCRSTSSS